MEEKLSAKERLKFFIFSALAFAIAMILHPVIRNSVTAIGLVATGRSVSEIHSAGAAQLYMLGNVLYQSVGIVLLGLIWYRKAFFAPSRGKEKAESEKGDIPRLVIAILLFAFGMYYVQTLVMNIISAAAPGFFANYQNLLSTYMGSATFVSLASSIVLAPVVEEIICRGLILGYARKAMPVWLAIIWQAVLFGVMHLNLVQGIYACIMGLVFGYLCYKGGGIRYTIPLHILCNIFGGWLLGLYERTLEWNMTIAIIIGIIAVIIGLLLVRSARRPKKEKQEETEWRN